MKKSYLIYICTLIIANIFAGTVLAQIQNENNVHNTYMIMQNNPPEMFYIEGPTTIKEKTFGRWEFHAFDNDSLLIIFVVDWGDGSGSTTLPVATTGGATGSATHMYLNSGDYTIKVHAQDLQGGNSEDLSYPVEVTPKKDKSINISFLQFLPNFLKNHPNLFPILQRLL